MKLSRNTRRRLVLYGTALVIALVALSIPMVIRMRTVHVPIKTFDVEAALRHPATKMLIDYVRIDTSNPPGLTREAVRLLADAFACEGIPYEIVGPDADRPLLVARLSGLERTEGLMLLHHVDVVPAGDLARWRVPPFAGAMGGRPEDQHYLFGRGTLDLKGLGVASFFAMRDLKRAGITPRRDIVYVAESCEESREPEKGIGWILKNRPDLVAGVTDVYNEGGIAEVVTTEIERFLVETVQKAAVSLWVDGPTEEELTRFGEFLEQRDQELPYRVIPVVRDYLKFIHETRGAFYGVALQDPDLAIRDGRIKQLPDVYRSLLRDRYLMGKPWRNPAGGWTMRLVATLLPGSSVTAFRSRVEGWVRDAGLRTRVDYVNDDSFETPRTGPAWRALETALRLDHPAAIFGHYVQTTAYTSSHYLRARGLRAYGIWPFNVNYFDMLKVHSPNERINVVYFVEGVERMTRIVREFATAP